MMKKDIKNGIFFFAVAILASGGLVYFDMPLKFLKASLVVDESPVPEMHYEVAQEKVPSTQWAPVLVNNVKTRINHNGYRVFRGYKTTDISVEDQLKYAQEVGNARQNRARIGVPRQRTTNYRKPEEEYQSSAPEEMDRFEKIRQRLAESKITLEKRRAVGTHGQGEYVPEYKTRRISLRATERTAGGTAEAFRRAKEKTQLRQEWESEVFAPNRVGTEDVTLSGRSRITIKKTDDRKDLLEYYEERKEWEKQDIIAPPPSDPDDVETDPEDGISSLQQSNATDPLEEENEEISSEEKILKELEAILEEIMR